MSTGLYGDYSNREAQYDAAFTASIEGVVGEGFLCTKGAKSVLDNFSGIELEGKKLLDFGCGLGGPAFLLAEHHFVDIVAVDVEPYVITEARKRIKDQRLKGFVEFDLIRPEGKLSFQANTFDVIYASECLLHVKDKELMLCELYRILKSGGVLIIEDWLHSGSEYSEQMTSFLSADGLSFYLLAPAEYNQRLMNAGFKESVYLDTSKETFEMTSQIIADLKSELGVKIGRQFGDAYLRDYIESWKLQAKVFERKEMLSACIKAYK